MNTALVSFAALVVASLFASGCAVETVTEGGDPDFDNAPTPAFADESLEATTAALHADGVEDGDPDQDIAGPTCEPYYVTCGGWGHLGSCMKNGAWANKCVQRCKQYVADSMCSYHYYTNWANYTCTFAPCSSL